MSSGAAVPLPEDLAALCTAVQRNCDIADARHAGELTLCNYLLQMREFHRWALGRPLGVALPREEVGTWIAEREALWDSLEDHPLQAVPRPAWGGQAAASLDPFEADALNAALLGAGWLYGAGRLGMREGGRPAFFLAELHASGMREGLTVLQAGREWARGLAAPPAVLAGGGRGPIVIRRESLARWCWQGIEAWSMKPREHTPWHAVVQAYGFAPCTAEAFAAALPRWLDDQVEVAVLHELGEYAVGQHWGERWSALRAALPTRRGELHAVAVRDLLADCTRTLPTLLERADAAPLHSWFAAFDGVREALCPALPAAYAAWCRGEGMQPIADAVAQARVHFEALAERVWATFQPDLPASAQRAEALLLSAAGAGS